MRCLQFMFARSRIAAIGFTIAWLILQAQLTLAQPLLVPGQNGVNLFDNANNNGGNQNANGNANNGQGGAAQADFDPPGGRLREGKTHTSPRTEGAPGHVSKAQRAGGFHV